MIQVWRSPADFGRVKAGDAVVNGSWGHSFIFLNYVYTGSAITGMVIADQGYQNGAPLAKGDYAYWVGANLVTAPPPPTKPAPDSGRTRYGPNP